VSRSIRSLLLQPAAASGEVIPCHPESRPAEGGSPIRLPSFPKTRRACGNRLGPGNPHPEKRETLPKFPKAISDIPKMAPRCRKRRRENGRVGASVVPILPEIRKTLPGSPSFPNSPTCEDSRNLEHRQTPDRRNSTEPSVALMSRPRTPHRLRLRKCVKVSQNSNRTSSPKLPPPPSDLCDLCALCGYSFPKIPEIRKLGLSSRTTPGFRAAPISYKRRKIPEMPQSSLSPSEAGRRARTDSGRQKVRRFPEIRIAQAQQSSRRRGPFFANIAISAAFKFLQHAEALPCSGRELLRFSANFPILPSP